MIVREDIWAGHDALEQLVLALRIEFSAQVDIKIERQAGGGRLYEAIR